MISVSDALSAIFQLARPLATESVSLGDSLDLVLAEEIACSMDSPPYDKALVDGYAVRAADVAVDRELEILEEVTAGLVPTRPVTPGTATRIMTGAPIPDRTEAVVMVERTETIERENKSFVRLKEATARVGQNIMRRGESMQVGQVVLRPGHRIRGIEVGLLAELGRPQIAVHRRPSVAVLATGNELVDVRETPGAGQIRNSNGPMLQALVQQCSCAASDLGVSRDTEEDLARLIGEGLRHDVLLLSGGVSAGVLDLVPKVLQSLGVRQVFHKVDMKPGKPLWFGVAGEGTDQPKFVFGLPGNPVSSLVCFHLFVRPLLARLAGLEKLELEQLRGSLAVDFNHKSDRWTYYPGTAIADRGALVVTPLPWRGSADLHTLAQANVLICLPPGPVALKASDAVEVRLL